ncbi:uncharacterized protein LOC144247297 [Lonchura striata]
MHQKGKSMLIQSNFKLKVLYKWDDHVVIKLPAALSGKVCGMCRNNRDLWDHALCLDALTCLPNSTHSLPPYLQHPHCVIPLFHCQHLRGHLCVLDANTCAAPSECGCVLQGLFYGLGEEFWSDLTCTQHSACDAERRQAVCRDSGCTTKEECEVE